jgi:hypothetical protein
MPGKIGEIRPPTTGFERFILYREPYETTDIWLIFPDEDESYRINIEYVRKWLMPMYKHDSHFVDLALDHFWNFYHVQMKPGLWNVNTLPLSDAYDYNLGSDGLDMVTRLANKVRSWL